MTFSCFGGAFLEANGGPYLDKLTILPQRAMLLPSHNM
jgi:hypothetical protein